MNVAGGRSRTVCAWCGLVGIVLTIAGTAGPWVSHETAALTVTGIELAELAKFFPEVQNGSVPVVRALFLTPIAAAAVLLGLWAARFVDHATLRSITTGLAVLLALVVLPPYGFYLAPDYRLHLLLGIGSGVLSTLTLMAHRLSPRFWGGLFDTFALAGIAPALVQFFLLYPLIVDLYGRAPGIGWGLVVGLGGFVLLQVTSLVAFFHETRPSEV